MTRVLHLVGSAMDAFFCDLSRLYAADCLDATAGSHDALVALVSPDGSWRFPHGLAPEDVAAAPPVTLPEAVAHIAAARIDVAVPQMFCLPGMTHHRALLDLLAIPYVGNPPDVMALGADKAKARAVVAAAGVAVPDAALVRPGDEPDVALPVVVKPVDADNSAGVTLVHRQAALRPALDAAFAHSTTALVEEFVPLGREVRCGIVERGGELVCLPLEEYAMDPVAKPVRLADDKLARDPDGELRLVAKDPARAWVVDPADPATAPVWAAARHCYRALGCRHYGLFDFRIDPAGTPFFLEAGLYCSFARTSVVATMAAAAGIPVVELFTDLVADVCS